MEQGEARAQSPGLQKWGLRKFVGSRTFLHSFERYKLSVKMGEIQSMGSGILRTIADLDYCFCLVF